MTYATQSTLTSTNAWTMDLVAFDPHTSVAPKEARISRPMNSWLFFRKQKARELKEANPGSNMPQAAISKIISELWKDAPEQVRRHYSRLAEQGRIDHSIKYPDYKLQPRLKKTRVRSTTSKSKPYSSSLSTFEAAAPSPPLSPTASSSSSSSPPSTTHCNFPSDFAYDLGTSTSPPLMNQSRNNSVDFYLSESPEPQESSAPCYVSTGFFDLSYYNPQATGLSTNWAPEVQSTFGSGWTWASQDYRWQ